MQSIPSTNQPDVKRLIRRISNYRTLAWVLLSIFILLELTIPVCLFGAVMGAIEPFYLPYLIAYHIGIIILFAYVFGNLHAIKKNTADLIEQDESIIHKKLKRINLCLIALTIIILLFNPVLTIFTIDDLVTFLMPNRNIPPRM